MIGHRPSEVMDELLLRRRAASGSAGTAKSFARYLMGNAGLELEEEIMPVILLWGIPTLIVVGGGAFWLIHAHH